VLSDIEIIRRVHFNTSGDTKEGKSVLLMEFLLKEFLLRTCAFGMHSQHVKSCASNVALLLELGKSFPEDKIGFLVPELLDLYKLQGNQHDCGDQAQLELICDRAILTIQAPMQATIRLQGQRPGKRARKSITIHSPVHEPADRGGSSYPSLPF
jgi:hypothetical protein